MRSKHERVLDQRDAFSKKEVPTEIVQWRRDLRRESTLGPFSVSIGGNLSVSHRDYLEIHRWCRFDNRILSSSR